MQARGIGWSVAFAFLLGCDSRPTGAVIERRVEQRLDSEPSLRGHSIDVTSIGDEVVRNQLRLGSPRVSSLGPAEPTSPRTSSASGGETTPDPSVLGRPGQPIVVASP